MSCLIKLIRADPVAWTDLLHIIFNDTVQNKYPDPVFTDQLVLFWDNCNTMVKPLQTHIYTHTPTQSTMQPNTQEESKGQLDLFIIPPVTKNQGALQPRYCGIFFLHYIYSNMKPVVLMRLGQTLPEHFY